MARLPNIHPGEVLLEEFLKPMGISQNKIARDIGVPLRRINEIVQGKRAVTADTALRLANYFDMSEAFWMGLQATTISKTCVKAWASGLSESAVMRRDDQPYVN